jgi:hypothetical protein
MSNLIREVPAGPIDGVNTTFTLSVSPEAGSVYLFLNGLLLEEGATADYTLPAAQTVVMTQAPLPGDKLDASYKRPYSSFFPPAAPGIGLDLSRDYLIIDDPQDIVFKSKVDALTHSAEYTIGWCQRAEEVKAAVDAAGDLRTRSTFWTMWRGPMEEAGFTGEPKRNDLVVHDGREYVVYAVDCLDKDRSRKPQRFRLACRHN